MKKFMILAAMFTMIAVFNCKKNEQKEIPMITNWDLQGLQAVDVKVGNGPAAEPGKGVVLQYVGTLDNGQEFDNSYTSKRPLGYTLGDQRVIPGWSIGIKGMKVGGVRKLIIPAALAYKEAGLGRIIPPNATLTFKVELMEVRNDKIDPPQPMDLD